ncbi:hypothetical protein MED121_22577 [Marinomonas sp. MED121]|uniref:hypothetical protein n=1 Tax=Marinomonas sp. MED121 TaxID=314277 RepID=UPI000068FD68|nr:hypothetical protein [Marinomonas sp. MED121]EAQ65505.1 hypothetical protein MED121_22577 [Marinomonas sp. MED121]
MKKSNRIKVSLFTFMSVFSTSSFAGFYQGPILSIGTGSHYDALCAFESCAVIMVDEVYYQGPNCRAEDSWAFVVRTDTNSGKSTYSQLLTAYSSGKEVVIKGTDSCSGIDSIETLLYAYFKFK